MMNTTKFLRLALTALGCSVLLSMPTSASELVYTPVNPTFGGNPANASGLQANAAAQNNYKAPVVTKVPLTALEKFNNQLQSAILSRLKGETLDGLFDGKGNLLAGGTVTFGNYIIKITQKDDGTLVMETSDITIPNSSTLINVGTVSDLTRAQAQ
jgi:curli production assembly/transport component CsgF